MCIIVDVHPGTHRDSNSQGDVGVSCVEAENCVGRTVFCTHEGAGHFADFHHSFPLNTKLAIFAFFQQHASESDDA